MTPNTRCSADPNFAADIADPIPAAQRASAADAELVAEVGVVREGAGLRATVQVFDRVLQSQAGARELSLPLGSCRQTADAISLVIGVLVEAGRTVPAALPEAVPEPPPEPPPPPEAPPDEPPTEGEPPEPPPAERKRYAWLGPKAGHDLTLQAGIGWGLLPGAYAGGTVGWGIRAPRIWPIWLSATGFLPRETDDDRGRFSAVYGSVAVCPLHGQNELLRGQLCPSFSAGALWSSGEQLPMHDEVTNALAMVGLDFKGDLRIAGPLALSLSGRVDVPLLRQDFVYRKVGRQTGDIHQVAPLTLTVLAGLSLLFR